MIENNWIHLASNIFSIVMKQNLVPSQKITEHYNDLQQ